MQKYSNVISLIDCTETLHYYCISPFMNKVLRAPCSVGSSSPDALLNLDPLTLDETLNWVEQIFQSSNTSQHGMLLPSKDLSGSLSPPMQLASSSSILQPSFATTQEMQMSFVQKVLYKTSIAYKVARHSPHDTARLNLITTLPKNFIRMLYRIGRLDVPLFI